MSRKIYDILKSNHNILQVNEEHRTLFKEVPMVSFRRAKCIKDVLVRAKLQDEKWQPGSCNKCNRSNCLVDDFLEASSTFTNSSGDRTYNLRKGSLYCNSTNVVYKLSCLTCGKQYIGSTIRKFRERFNLYKSQFKKYRGKVERGDMNPGEGIAQAGLFEHFLSDGHNGLDDWSFQIIDQAETTARVRDR